MMELANKKNVKVISLAIAAIMIVGVFVLAVQGGGFGQDTGTLNSAIGKVNYQQLISAVPGIADAQTEMRKLVEENQKEVEEKTKNMSDADKQKFQAENAKEMQKKEQELVAPLKKKVEEAILSVGKTKGLTVIVNQEAVVYGGVDVTADVQAALKKQKK